MPNKNYFAQLSPKQKAELFLIYTGNGMYNLKEIMDHYNSEMERAYSSTEKDMVARMHDINAPYLTDEEGNKMTHRMASGDSYVFPTIQRNDNGDLESYEDTDDWGAQRAIERNDTLQFRLPSLAEYFLENYKTHLDNPNMFSNGGDENELKRHNILKQAISNAVSFLSAREDAMSKMYDVTEDVIDGRASYYPFSTNERGFPENAFYIDDSGHIYEYPGGEFYDMADAAGLKHLPFVDLQKRLPKRDYIGGSGYELRVAQMLPGFVDEVKKRAESYGLNPNLMMRRLIKEGFLRNLTREYNEIIPTSEQVDYFKNYRWDLPVSGYHFFGLDYAGDNLLNGKYELKDRNATWTDDGQWGDSEAGGRSGEHRAIPNNLYSALEMMAAELAYRRKEVKRLYNPSEEDLDAYTSASYNWGLRGSIFKNRDKVVSEFGSYPDYYKQLEKEQK